MRITQKQQEEIDWICKHFCNGYIPTQEEMKEYIQISVYGKGSGKVGTLGHANKNPILNGKRALDIQIKMWRKDIADGFFMVSEFDEEGLMEGYGDKIFKSIMQNLPKKDGKGVFRTPSILWANERWRLKITIDPTQFYEDYKNIKLLIK